MDKKTIENFSDLNLSAGLMKAIEELGFEEPTPIQKLTIPHALQGRDIIGQAQNTLSKSRFDSADRIRAHSRKIIVFSHSMQALRQPLRDFLMDNLYRNYRVIRMSNKAKRFIRELFQLYVKQPRQLPAHFQKRIKQDGVYRVVCDYIAGMTDRYALDEYKKLFDPYEKV